jgi:hypothetical protein
MINELGHHVFHASCLLATIIFIVKCIFQYQEDSDITQVEYRTFHDLKEAIYPSISLCFLNPISNEKIVERVGPNFNQSHYSKHLWNAKRNKALLDVDYDDVTINLFEHLLEIKLHLQNHLEEISWTALQEHLQVSNATKDVFKGNTVITKNLTKEELLKIPHPKVYISQRRVHSKCYSVDIPFVQLNQMKSFKISINGSAFNYKIRPSRKELTIYFHYPNQNLKAFSAANAWKSRFNESLHYVKHIYLAYVNVLHRRNKANSPCHDENHDEEIIRKAIANVKCKPRFIKTEDKAKFCETRSEHKSFYYQIHIEKQIPPCRSLQSIYDWYEEENLPQLPGELPRMDLIFAYEHDFYKEMIYLRGYTVESLIGNAGGYIG